MSHPTNLPPAGHQRNEELRRRTDQLDELGEQTRADVEAINPAKLRVENELASHFNELDVADSQPEFVYCWENFVNQNGYAVRARLSVRVPEDGHMQVAWEVVHGTKEDMPEAWELRAVDGTRKLGDVMLMRCRKDRYLLIQRARKAHVRAMTDAADAPLLELAEEIGEKYVKLHHDMPPDHPAMKHALAQSIASKALAQQIRDGNVGQ